MGDLFGLKKIIDDFLWREDAGKQPVWRRWLLEPARIGYVFVRDVFDGDLNQRAVGLVYWTLLSVVPLFAISFSVLKGFGAHNRVEPLLLDFLAPLGEKGVEATAWIIRVVEQVDVGVLGSVGLLSLVYSVISLMQKIERSFNHIWYVSRARSIARRFSDYISVILVGPLLIMLSASLTAALSDKSFLANPENVFLAYPAAIGAAILPYALAVAAFAFIFLFMPNTKVQLRAAIVGALVTAGLWKLVGWGFTALVVHSAKNALVYSVFLTPILFMMWLFLVWMMLLNGASIAFYIQNPSYLRLQRGRFQMSNRLSERIALHAAYRMAKSYHRGEAPWTAPALAQALNVPTLAVETVLDELERCALVSRTSDEPSAYLPKRPIDQITVLEVLGITRERGEREQISAKVLPVDAAVDHMVDMMERAVTKSVHGMTLLDLATTDIPAGEDEPTVLEGRKRA